METAPAKWTRGRLWFATIATILLLIAVWKFIDYRMRPPPPSAPLTQSVKP
jgi:hypothetical protein